MVADLSKYTGRNGVSIMRQVSTEPIVKRVSDRWSAVYVECEFYLQDANKWIPCLHKIKIVYTENRK